MSPYPLFALYCLVDQLSYKYKDNIAVLPHQAIIGFFSVKTATFSAVAVYTFADVNLQVL